MARRSKTKGKAGDRKARKAGRAKARMNATTKRRAAPAAKPRKRHSASELEAQLQRQTIDLNEALEQQAATADVLKVISRSAFDVQTVTSVILRAAAKLCRASMATLHLRDGDVCRLVVQFGLSDAFEKVSRDNPIPVQRPLHSRRQARVGEFAQFADAWNDPDYLYKSTAKLGGYRAIIVVPMMRENELIGIFSLGRPDPEPFTADQIKLVQTFSDQAAIAIENARLFNDVKTKTDDLSEALQMQTATADVLKVISRSAFDLDAVLLNLVSTAVRLCNSGTGQIFRREGDVYRYAASQININPSYRQHEQEAKIRAGRGTLIGRVALLKRTVMITDAWSDPEYEEKDEARIGNVRAMLGVPLMRSGEPIGAFALARSEPIPFTERQIELVTTFADQAVIAIENTRLFNETQEALEQQKASADILSVISNSVADTQPVFDKILESCKRLFGGDELDVLLVDEQGQLNIAAYIGVSHDVVAATFPAPVERTPAGRAIRERKVMHWPDLVDGEDVPGVLRKMAKLIGYRSMMFAPMLWEDRGVGAIGVARSTGPFKPEELSLLQTFADQAVIAIQNARLFNETKEALEQQTATSDVLQIISKSTFNLEPVFRTLVENAARLCGAQTGMIFQSDGGLMRLAAAEGASKAFVDYVTKNPIAPHRGSATGLAALERRTVHILDAEIDPDYAYGGRSLERYRTIVAVPLMRGETPVGAFTLWRHHVQAFTPRQIALVETFADQAVVAIENVRLFNETKEALERQTATADILKVIASSPDDVQPVFQAIAERSNRLVSGLSTTVLSIDGDTIHLSAFTRTNPAADAALVESFPRKLSELAFGESVARGRIYRLPDTEAEPTLRELARLRGYRSMLFVPLLRDGVPIGMIGQTRAEPGPFAESHVELLKTFADQAVIAISNVRLFQEVQERTRELSQSLNDLRTTQDRLVQTEKLASLGQLTAGIAHEIKNPLNFVNNFSALSAELIDELDDTLAPAPLNQQLRGEVDELTQILKSNLEKVVQHGKRADSIVKNMLLHSREGSGEQRLADINALLDESLNLAYHGARAEKAGFNITLQRDFDASVGSIELFPQEITRAFLNLISNGFYAATKRKTENVDPNFEPVLSAATKNLGGSVEIRIRDNGAGIPAEVKEKMFNPFYTTKPAGEGTGLGLSMSHDIIVKQHGGIIDVDTALGAFTEFRIVLPRAGASLIKSGEYI